MRFTFVTACRFSSPTADPSPPRGGTGVGLSVVNHPIRPAELSSACAPVALAASRPCSEPTPTRGVDSVAELTAELTAPTAVGSGDWRYRRHLNKNLKPMMQAASGWYQTKDQQRRKQPKKNVKCRMCGNVTPNSLGKQCSYQLTRCANRNNAHGGYQKYDGNVHNA